MTGKRLIVENFAQIRTVDIEFGDLTVLVGAQGTGKSIVLQWLKAALDHGEIVAALQGAGHDVRGPDGSALIDLIFGVGMAPGWSDGHSRVVFDGKALTFSRLRRRTPVTTGRAFFVPAHRAMLISDGWAAPFQKLSAETPVVARLFSQRLFELFSGRVEDELFPVERLLKGEYRELLNAAVFHGGHVKLEMERHAYRLKLTHGKSDLPLMTWSSGQREFTPLLLGLYDVLPPRKQQKHPHIDWIIVEEPEMGLHPQAISVFMLLVLDLLWRKYNVVLSTHSPLILDVIWMMKRLQEISAGEKYVCDAFGVEHTQAVRKVAQVALSKSFKTYLLAFGSDSQVTSTDISQLDPGAENLEEAGWGGLTGFSTRFGDVVRAAANEADRR